MSSISPDSLNRQSEINEWYYKYRRDTLFILQLVFIGVSVVLLMTILSKYKIVSPIFVVYIAVFIAILLLIVWIFKYKYNTDTRDFYHWDKRRFPGDGKLDSEITPAVQQAMSDILASCKK